MPAYHKGDDMITYCKDSNRKGSSTNNQDYLSDKKIMETLCQLVKNGVDEESCEINLDESFICIEWTPAKLVDTSAYTPDSVQHLTNALSVVGPQWDMVVDIDEKEPNKALIKVKTRVPLDNLPGFISKSFDDGCDEANLADYVSLQIRGSLNTGDLVAKLSSAIESLGYLDAEPTEQNNVK